MKNALVKTDLFTLVYDNSFYQATSIHEAYEFIIRQNDVDTQIFVPSSSLSLEDVEMLDREEKFTMAIINENGEHMTFENIYYYQMLWFMERATDEEYIYLFKSDDVMNKEDFKKIREQELTKKGIEIFGRDIWIIIQEYLSIFEYDVVFMKNNMLRRVDLQCYCEDDIFTYEEFIMQILSVWQDRVQDNYDEDLIEYFTITIEIMKRYLEENKILDSMIITLNCPTEEHVEYCVAYNTNKHILGRLIDNYNKEYDLGIYDGDCLTYLEYKGIKIEPLKVDATFNI